MNRHFFKLVSTFRTLINGQINCKNDVRIKYQNNCDGHKAINSSGAGGKLEFQNLSVDLKFSLFCPQRSNKVFFAILVIRTWNESQDVVIIAIMEKSSA